MIKFSIFFRIKNLALRIARMLQILNHQIIIVQIRFFKVRLIKLRQDKRKSTGRVGYTSVVKTGKRENHRRWFTCIYGFRYRVFEGWASRGLCTSVLVYFCPDTLFPVPEGLPPCNGVPLRYLRVLVRPTSGCYLPSSVMPASAWLCLARCLRHPRLSP